MSVKTPSEPVMGELVVMSQTPMGEIANIHIDLDKNDVLAVALSEAEEHLQETITAEKQRLVTLAGQITEITKQIHDACLAHGKSKMANKVTALGAALRAFNVAPHAGYSIAAPAIGDKEFKLSVTITDGPPKESSYYNKEVLERKIAVKTPPTVSKLLTQLAAVQERHEEVGRQLVEWRRKLGDIPTLERRYRAELAKIKIAETEPGREFLTKMIQGVKKHVLKLGFRA